MLRSAGSYRACAVSFVRHARPRLVRNRPSARRSRAFARAGAARRHARATAPTTSTTTSSTPSPRRREHRRFIAILERFTTVYQVRDLLADILANAESRDLLIRETMDIVPSEPLARDISELQPRKRSSRCSSRDEEEPPGPIAQGAQRAGLRAAAAAESLLHARQLHGRRRSRARRLDALRDPVDGSASS